MFNISKVKPIKTSILRKTIIHKIYLQAIKKAPEGALKRLGTKYF